MRIGTRLVPQLIQAGHDVIGTSRTQESAARVRALGAEPLVLDLLEPLAVWTQCFAPHSTRSSTRRRRL